ncbi:MAG: S9 family peptidase [Hyphomonadaceae bacterium]
MNLRVWLLAIVTACIAAPVSAQQSTRPIAVDDVQRLIDISEPLFTRDGASVIFTASESNVKDDVSVSDLWIVDAKGGTPRRLTSTPTVSESTPRVSADGKHLAFISDVDEAGSQVWMIDLPFGAAHQVSAIQGGVSDFDLSPDGETIIAVAEVGARVGEDPEKPGAPIVIDRFVFKADGSGYLDDRRQQLFGLDVATGNARQITHGNFDHLYPRISPDGKSIALISKQQGDPDRNGNYDIYVLPLSGEGELRAIGSDPRADGEPDWDSPPAWSPDSKQLVWLRSGEDKWIYYSPQQLVVADVASGKARELAHIDRWFTRQKFSADGKSILSLIEQDRDTWLAKIDIATGSIEYLTSGARFAFDFTVSPQGALALLDGDASTPFSLRALKDGAWSPLADLNPWLHEVILAPYQDLTWRSGGTDIHGILVLPPNHKPGEKHPLIVKVHGGPVYQFSHEFMLEWQAYAAKGYAVLAVNPRGSSGRGFDFAKAIYADWGNKDAADVSAGIDAVIKMGVVDAGRIGVGGWSYGGILTNYMIASDKRIKAAVSGAGMSHFIGGYGADQYAREYEFELGTPWDHPDVWRRVSYPFFKANTITAATMFLCSQEDTNVPCLGGEQMYQALRSRGVSTRLVVYPGETHSLSTPSHVQDRIQRSLDWYDAHLRK